MCVKICLFQKLFIYFVYRHTHNTYTKSNFRDNKCCFWLNSKQV